MRPRWRNMRRFQRGDDEEDMEEDEERRFGIAMQSI
jgi:hypothetical protein